MTTQPYKRFESVSGRFLFAVIYASGEKGKHVRADGKGGKLARGFYYCLNLKKENPVLIGAFFTATRAAHAARLALSAIPESQAESYHMPAPAPFVRAVYNLKAGGMGATLSNGQKVRLNAPALGHALPPLGSYLSPHEYESL
ncbi:MAG: hypothetical protein PHS57_08890 [Alphaproteobacteria bacterium]|nr:hypothetical protein [Alphaproteobacteria bacterium]